MIYIESLMLATVMFTLVVATITDFKKGVIPNKMLIAVGIVNVFLDIIYYSCFYNFGIYLFLSDIFSIFILAIIFYAVEIWAAGDSKLLMITALGIPSRLYSFMPFSFCPLFVLVMIVFSLAFLYSAGETLVKSIKEKRKVWKEIGINFSLKKLLYIVITLIFMATAILLCNIVFNFILANSEENYVLLMLAVDFILTLLLMEIIKRFSIIIIAVFSIVFVAVASILYGFGLFNLSFGKGGLLSIIVLLLTIFIRILSGKYNYQEIPVEKLNYNMILSLASSIRINMSFPMEKPLLLTENRKARLTQEQVECIKKSATKRGLTSVMIVRKLPFAVYIFVGTIIFLSLEAAYLWFI